MVIVSGIVFKITTTEWLFVVLAIGIVLTAELLNTAIEMIVDFIAPDFHRKAGKIKDIAAGAVLMAALTSAIIGAIIFTPYILKLL